MHSSLYPADFDQICESNWLEKSILDILLDIAFSVIFVFEKNNVHFTKKKHSSYRYYVELVNHVVITHPHIMSLVHALFVIGIALSLSCQWPASSV